MIRRILFLVAALCGVFLAVPASAQEVLFAYGFTAGSTQHYRMKLSQELNFNDNAITQIGDLEVTIKCTSVADGKAMMEMVFDKVEMTREMFGTQNPDPLGEALAGHGILYRVDEAGAVSDIQQSGAYEGWDRIQPFVEPIVKGWYVTLPNKTYAPGASWMDTHNDKSADGTEATVTTNFTYQQSKDEGGRSLASVTGDTQTRATGQSVSPMGTFDVDGGGKGKVEFLFDPATRQVLKLKSKMNVDMNLKPAVGGDPIETHVAYELERELL